MLKNICPFLILVTVLCVSSQYSPGRFDPNRYGRRRTENLNQQGGSCHDDRSCHPPVGNLLIGREVNLTASSTCGTKGNESYCVLSNFESRKKCYTCNSKDRRYFNRRTFYHGIEKVVNHPGVNQFNYWWQAENGKEDVSIRFDLWGEFHFTHIVMVFKTFRPAAMVIERSYDYDRTWQPYAYFAADCARSFPGIPTYSRNKIDDVVCSNKYSSINPSRGGEVIFRVLPPQIKIDDPYSYDVEKIIKITNLRINFTKLHTLGDDYLDDRPEIMEKYYYGLYSMTVRGSCSCYGHASECIAEPGQPQVEDMVYGRCNCEHFTTGLNCEKCMDLYNDLPWDAARGPGGKTFVCKKCQCHNHATSCRFDRAVYAISGNVSGGVCIDCSHNTEGKNCESCKPFYYKDPLRSMDDPSACQPCDCDPIGSMNNGTCDRMDDHDSGYVAGKCHCKYNVDGRRCDRCKVGFWKLDRANPKGCIACTCNVVGTVGNQGCNQKSGECICKRNVIGRDCNQCQQEYYGLGKDELGCKACDCDPGGSLDNTCDIETGQCKCRPNVKGRRCDKPEDGYFSPALDYLTFEAELASGTPGTALFVRPPYPGQSTGIGYMRVYDNSSLTFDIVDIPRTMNYYIQVRFEPNSRINGEAKVYISRTVGSFPDPESPCRNKLNFGDRRMLKILPNERVGLVTGESICLDQGQQYEIQIEMDHISDTSGRGSASMLLDSIVLIPVIDELPMFIGSIGEQRLKEYKNYRCGDSFYNLAIRDSRMRSSSLCSKYWHSISYLINNGAIPCNCDPMGSKSATCDPLGGFCDCKTNVIGRECKRCAPAHYGFGPEGCIPCDCHQIGALDQICDLKTGQCKCRPNTYGRQCDECQPGYWNYPSCQRCSCNGHADTCDSRTGICKDCRDSTAGSRCESCDKGYYGNPILGQGIPCRPCPCPGSPDSGLSHADTCRLDSLSGSPICMCSTGYTGQRCDECADNYFGDANIPGGECRPCNCSGNIDISQPNNCDKETGQCLQCLYHTIGDNCERCENGYYGDARSQNCARCVCNPQGTDPTSGHCDHITGQCYCLPHVIGTNCNECELNHWNIGSGEGCQPCDCDPQGSYVLKCSELDGQCHCKPGHGGQKCDQCQPNFYGDPRIECFPCECNPSGALDSQCDRKNGTCSCVKGIAGQKCDQCARGYTGKAPYCESCGECFKNWDEVVLILKERTKALLDRAKKIKQTGTMGAYKDEFNNIERKLNQIDDIIEGAEITKEELDNMKEIINQLREELQKIEEHLNKAESDMGNTVDRITNANLALSDLKRQAELLNVETMKLDNNMTELQKADVLGAYNITKDALRRSRNAEKIVRDSEQPLYESERLRKKTEKMIAQAAGFYNRTNFDIKSSLNDIGIKVARLETEIPDINEQVCGGRSTVETCELCGGATCPNCGGSSCQGATTIARNGFELGKTTDEKLKELKEKAQDELDKSDDARSKSEEALRQAKLAYDRILFTKNSSEEKTRELQDLLDKIDMFLDEEKATPATIRAYAEECLKKKISLSPEKIIELSKRINMTISSLTDIERILMATAGDLATANNLKAKAELAKENADAILETAKQVIDALEKALEAQGIADRAIRDAKKSIAEAQDDLNNIEGEMKEVDDLSATAANQIEKLKERLDALKRKYTQNELDVDKATNEAEVAKRMSEDAGKGTKQLENEYKRAKTELEEKVKMSGEAKDKANDLLNRARNLAEKANEKLNFLIDIEDSFIGNERDLTNYKEKINELNRFMGGYLDDIERKAKFHRECRLDSILLA